jgi:hypothetical protein
MMPSIPDPSRIFVSYSRREFYFAESLAIRLQHDSIPVWFDSQQIALGEQWAHDIQEGLTNSGKLVLIASQASIASPYVAKEWQHALEQHKPIHIILFEAVVLPTELMSSAASIIDGRSGFEANYPRLLACIKGEQTIRDPLPSVGPFGLPTKLSPTLRTLLVSRFWLWLIYGLFLFAELVPLVQSNAQSLAPVLTLAGVGMFAVVVIVTGTSLWRILRRTFAHKDVIFLTSYREVTVIALSVGYTLYSRSQLARTTSFTYLFAAVGAGFLVYWWRFGRPAKWHIDLLSWYPLTAQPPNEWRAIVQSPYLDKSLDIQLNAPVVSGEEPQYPILNKPVKPGAKLFEKAEVVTPAAPAVMIKADSKLRGKTFHLYHAPLDVKPAHKLKAWLLYFGLIETADAEKADYSILYLTHRTSKTFAYQLSEKHSDLICILGESIKMPQDTPDSFRGIQWFDYRTRQSDRLYAALDALGDSSESARAVQALNTTPPQLSSYSLTRELQDFWRGFGCVGTGCLGLGLTGAAFVISMIIAGSLSTQVLMAAICVLALLANAAFFYRTAWQAVRYQPIQRASVWLCMIGGLVLVIAVAWLGITMMPTPYIGDRIILIVMVVILWMAFAGMIFLFDSQKVFSVDTDAFGPPERLAPQNWFILQGMGLIFGIFALNTLWTGEIAAGEFVANLMLGK